jgi:hypothetical protein
MLFRKKLPRSCAYCIHSTKLNYEEVLCIKRGISRIDKSCRKFKYDPCKRIPMKPKASDFSKYDTEDFTL